MDQTERTDSNGHGPGLYIDTIKDLKNQRLGSRTHLRCTLLRSTHCGWVTGTAKAEPKRESTRMVLMNINVFTIGWAGDEGRVVVFMYIYSLIFRSMHLRSKGHGWGLGWEGTVGQAPLGNNNYSMSRCIYLFGDTVVHEGALVAA